MCILWENNNEYFFMFKDGIPISVFRTKKGGDVLVKYLRRIGMVNKFRWLYKPKIKRKNNE